MTALKKATPQATARARAFLTFVVEQHPFALGAAGAALGAVPLDDGLPSGALLERGALIQAHMRGTLERQAPGADLGESTPFVTADVRYAQELARVDDAVAAHFARAALEAAITDDEHVAMLRGVILTRAVDNRLKQLFLSSEMRYGELGFQGKGFRSLGQEAIYGAALRLKKGPAYSKEGRWTGDVVAPLIRDLGVTLAFTDDILGALNAQVGKDGPPSWGRDLHLGAPERGVIMVAAPLSLATCTVTGHALAFQRRAEPRVAVSFIGEGGSSLGEWHEAINLAASQRLPTIFCLENNQTALSTPVGQQSRVRTFADKALGYGIPHVTVDGTDAAAIAAAFAWAADRARAGHGPCLIETVAMRMAGHAHHDDMLYLGGDPPLSFSLPPVPDKGYADKGKYAQWAARDPLARAAARLVSRGVLDDATVARYQREATARVDAAVDVLRERSWPDAATVGAGVYDDGRRTAAHPDAVAIPALPPPLQGGSTEGNDDVEVAIEAAPAFSPQGQTFLDAIGRGVLDAFDDFPEAFVLGEDVGPPYGNAFLLLKPVVDKAPDRVLNTPIAEGAIIGACVGAAVEGLRPIGEIQFNDFVASGFNQLVNNAAKLRFRAGTKVPMTLRMPWGGLRRAGPYHSQDTSPWFFRTPGLNIVAPSTPWDARGLLRAAVACDDPVLFYEHIGLYRDPKIKQPTDDDGQKPFIPLGKAAFRRLGTDLSIIAYGAYVHRALKVAKALEDDGFSCDVLDLRSLVPLDWPRIAATVKRTGKVLLVGEDSRSGSILESIASRVGESLYEHLDGPVRVLGSLDTPVPYSPSLEDAFLLSERLIEDTARALLAW